MHVQSNETCLNYQNELDQLKKINEQKRARERELEIINDDLERKIRFVLYIYCILIIKLYILIFVVIIILY